MIALKLILSFGTRSFSVCNIINVSKVMNVVLNELRLRGVMK
jgi:hypothetical protein